MNTPATPKRLEDYPTPETDAVNSEELDSLEIRYDQMHNLAEGLERRLAACRDALEVARVGMCAVAVPDAAEREVLNDAFDYVTKTLELTKP